MKFFLVLVLFFCSSSMASVTKATPVRSTKARIAVFKEYFEKSGVDFILKKEKICDVQKILEVYDLTLDPSAEYRGTWLELCAATLDGIAGTVSFSSDVIISNQDLFADGKPSIYSSLIFSFGFGPVGGPYSVVGNNSTLEKDVVSQNRSTLKIRGQGILGQKEQLSIVVEAED